MHCKKYIVGLTLKNNLVALNLSSLKLMKVVTYNEGDWFNQQKLKIFCYLNHKNVLSWF